MADEVIRVNYFNGQFLRENDFDEEQAYHIRHQRDHAKLLHTPGIAEGLTIPDPAAGATAVLINAGVAFDEQGRRIVLADNTTLELQDLPADQAVYVTVAYDEAETHPTSETGTTGFTRWTEAPVIERSATAPGNPNEKLVLARIARSGTTVSAVDRSERRVAGVKGGDLAVRTLTLTSDAIAPSGWVTAQLGTGGRADVGGNLRVAGNLVVTGSITGDIAVGTVQAGDIQDNAVVSTTIAEADGTSAQNTNAGSGVKTGHIQNGAVTLAKLAANAVDAARIVDLSVGTTKLADGSVTLQKLAPAVQPIVSIQGVSNPGGNVALIQTGAITITPDAGNNRIIVGETHSAVTGNPHGTTAAQVNALALTGGTLSGSLQVNGNVGINVAPATRLHVAGTSPAVRIADGSQGAGRVLVSDAIGNATWRDNSRYFISGSLNVASINVSTTFVKMADYLVFAKASAESTVEITLNTRAGAGTFSGATGIRFQVRIDDAAAGIANEAAITTSNIVEYIGVFAVFQGLAAGNHTVSVWARTNAGSSTGVILDPGGFGGRLIAKETF